MFILIFIIFFSLTATLVVNDVALYISKKSPHIFKNKWPTSLQKINLMRLLVLSKLTLLSLSHPFNLLSHLEPLLESKPDSNPPHL